MIKLTRLNNQEFVTNAELIEFIDSTPETIISLTTGKKIVVKETAAEVVAKVIEYRQKAFPIVRKQEYYTQQEQGNS